MTVDDPFTVFVVTVASVLVPSEELTALLTSCVVEVFTFQLNEEVVVLFDVDVLVEAEDVVLFVFVDELVLELVVVFDVLVFVLVVVLVVFEGV